MAVKYSKAPISELYFGITFNNNILLNNGVLFQFLAALAKEFPHINTFPPQGDSVLIDGILQTSLDYSKSGFSTYRLYTSDNKYHVFVQQDAIRFHWVRTDIEPVGNYPGFSTVYEKFSNIYSTVENLQASYDQKLSSEVKSYTLAYVDRINFEEYKTQGFSIEDVILTSFPSFSVKNKTYKSNNCFNRYSVNCEEINGYSIIGINTPTLAGFGQIFIVENTLRGYVDDMPMKDWFDIAHTAQLSFFENTFTKKILKVWE